MEIHAPEHPVRNFSDILLHLAIVTVGILIAIGLESLVEWQHHRQLAEEARANIREEMRANRGKLADLLTSSPKIMQDQITVIGSLEDLLAHKPLKAHELSVNWRMVALVDSGWTTAQSVGALSLLPYPEVKRYAEVYDLQRLFAASALKAEETTSTSIGLFATGKEPGQYQDWELKTETARVQEAYGAMFVETTLGQSLIKEYDTILKEK